MTKQITPPPPACEWSRSVPAQWRERNRPFARAALSVRRASRSCHLRPARPA